jgi:Putative restriction endonuclease
MAGSWVAWSAASAAWSASAEPKLSEGPASVPVAKPATRTLLRDTETKRALYARARVPSYWIVLPGADQPEIALAELVLDGPGYRYATHYPTGVFRTELPWPVEVDLPALAARRERLRRLAPG